MGREDVSKGLTKVRELAAEVFGRRVFQVGGTIGTKALGWKCSRYIEEQLLRKMWLEKNEQR